MLAIALIVFREVLEAALIVGIVLAATRGVARRGHWVSLGVAGGLVGAAIVAAFAEAISTAAAGMGQEIFNAAVLFLAVVMLSWHNVWMSRHAREMTRELASVGQAISIGARPLSALAVVVGLAVLREGSEVVLFLYGIVSAGANEWGANLTGGVLGLAGGAAMGVALYAGLLRIPTRLLFTVTGWMILLLAAGMAAQGAGYLVQADILPALGTRVWDTSWLLSENSIIGQMLHTLIGYDDRPSGIQILFYLGTVAVVGGLMLRTGKSALNGVVGAAAEPAPHHDP